MLTFLQTSFPTLDIPQILQFIGIAGFIAYMTGFAALQMGYLDGNGPSYALTNVIGATLVLISLASAFNLASMLTQVSWIFIGCCGILRYNRRKTPTFKSRRTQDPSPHMSETEQTATTTPHSLAGKEGPLWLAKPVVKGRRQKQRLIGQPGTPTYATVYRRPKSSAQTRSRISTAQPYMS